MISKSIELLKSKGWRFEVNGDDVYMLNNRMIVDFVEKNGVRITTIPGPFNDDTWLSGEETVTLGLVLLSSVKNLKQVIGVNKKDPTGDITHFIDGKLKDMRVTTDNIVVKRIHSFEVGKFSEDHVEAVVRFGIETGVEYGKGDIVHVIFIYKDGRFSINSKGQMLQISPRTMEVVMEIADFVKEQFKEENEANTK